MCKCTKAATPDFFNNKNYNKDNYRPQAHCTPTSERNPQYTHPLLVPTVHEGEGWHKVPKGN